MKKVLVNLMLLFVSISLMLVLFEIYLRVFHSQHTLGGHAYFDDNIGIFRLIPNKEIRIKYPEFEYILKSNSKGLRDYEYSYKKSKDVFRTIVFGDSFTFGQGVELEHTFAKQLENKLENKDLSKSIEVINMGMEGYGTDDCYKFLINEGYKYNPDLVIYAFFVNDFNDVLNKVKKPKVDNVIKIKSDDSIVVNKVSFNPKETLQKTYAYHFFLNSLKKMSIIRNYLYSHGISKAGEPLYFLENYIQFEYTESAKEAMDLTFDYILKMNAFCRDIGANFLIFYFPDYFQAYYKEVKNNMGKSYDEKYDMDKPQKLIQKFCDEKHILYFDTTPFFRQEARLQRLYYDSDQHFTKQGHKLAAKIIYDKLDDLELLDRLEKSTTTIDTHALPMK